MRFIILLLLISFAVQAQEKARKPTHLQTEPLRRPSHLQTTPAPERVPNRTMGTTLSTGSLGTKPVNTITVRFGMIELTTGTIGNESVEIITVTPDKD